METARLRFIQQDIEQAARLLKAGELVAFPTETVYGLGADALNPEAVNKIFAAKGRPSDNPLIVHIGNQTQLAELVEEIPAIASKLMDAFWPGPLTIILPRRTIIPNGVTAGLETVGIRMPDHPVALALLQKSGVPVAAPSANRSGRPSPTSASHVLDDLDGRIAAVVDAGTTGVGVESTVIDVTVNPPMILRPGGVTREMVEKVIGSVEIDPSLTRKPVQELNPQEGPVRTATQEQVPRSPGMKYTHYAPKGEMWIVEATVDKQQAIIQSLADRARKEGFKTGILTTDERKNQYNADITLSCGSRLQLETVAAGLYGVLREFDQQGVERIYAESFSEEGIGFAIMNRLRKAAGYRLVGDTDQG